MLPLKLLVQPYVREEEDYAPASLWSPSSDPTGGGLISEEKTMTSLSGRLNGLFGVGAPGTYHIHILDY